MRSIPTAREVTKEPFNLLQAFAYSYVLITWGPSEKHLEIVPILGANGIASIFRYTKTKLGGIHE